MKMYVLSGIVFLVAMVIALFSMSQLGMIHKFLLLNSVLAPLIVLPLLGRKSGKPKKELIKGIVFWLISALASLIGVITDSSMLAVGLNGINSLIFVSVSIVLVLIKEK